MWWIDPSAVNARTPRDARASFIQRIIDDSQLVFRVPLLDDEGAGAAVVGGAVVGGGAGAAFGAGAGAGGVGGAVVVGGSVAGGAAAGGAVVGGTVSVGTSAVGVEPAWPVLDADAASTSPEGAGSTMAARLSSISAAPSPPRSPTATARTETMTRLRATVRREGVAEGMIGPQDELLSPLVFRPPPETSCLRPHFS
jgi:hypothetical protein